MAAAKLTAAEVALHNAISSGDEATVRARLAQVANVNCVDEKGDFPLIKGVRSGNRGVVQALLDRGANVNATNKAGSSALIAAGMNGHADIAAALLARGANINQRTAGHDSAVSLAVWKNHTDVALVLIQQNAAVDTQDKFGDCPLHDSAKHGNIKLITPLLAKLPHRLNAKNAKGQTPLHCAAMHGHGDAVRILLAHGADTSVLDDEKKAAYDHAANEEVNKLLSPNHLKQIEQVLHESKLKFEDKSNDENAPHFRFLLVRPQPIELQEIKIQISRKATLIVYSSCTQRIPVARRGQAAEFVARVNFDLPAAGGNFELDMRDGEVRYKTSFGFNRISDIKEMTRVFIAEHSTLYEPYLLAAVDVGKGADPKHRYGELKKKMGL